MAWLRFSQSSANGLNQYLRHESLWILRNAKSDLAKIAFHKLGISWRLVQSRMVLIQTILCNPVIEIAQAIICTATGIGTLSEILQLGDRILHGLA